MDIFAGRTYPALFLSALALSLALVPLVRRLAVRLGAFDPPSQRRVHEAPTPTMGGLAVALPLYALLGGLAVWDNVISRRFFADFGAVSALLVGGGIILAIGVYDDIRGSGARLKFVVQIFAALAVCALMGPVRAIEVPGLGLVELGLAAVPLTVFWIVALTNAFNLIDGVDGLAGGVAFIVCAACFLLASAQGAGGMAMMIVTAVLCGSLLGFLFHNFHPATIFLGDTGSLFVGFALAVISMRCAMKTATTALVVVPLFIAGYPLLDLSLAVVRRWIKGKPLFSSDRAHIHHKLLQKGHSHRAVSLAVYAFAGLMSLVGLLFRYQEVRYAYMGVALLTALLVDLSVYYGYWGYIFRKLSSKLRREFRLCHICVERAKLKLALARNDEEKWNVLCQLAEDFDLHHLRWLVGKESFDWFGKTESDLWRNANVVSATGAQQLVLGHLPGKDEDLELEQNLLLEEIVNHMVENPSEYPDKPATAVRPARREEAFRAQPTQ